MSKKNTKKHRRRQRSAGSGTTFRPEEQPQLGVIHLPIEALAAAEAIETQAPDLSALDARFKKWVVELGWRGWVILGAFLILPRCFLPVVGLWLGKPWIEAVQVPLDLSCEFGIAILVFSLVSITVEQFARAHLIQDQETRLAQLTAAHQGTVEAHNRHIADLDSRHDTQLAEIRRSVFYHIMQLPLDQPTVDHLMDHVFRQTWCRTNYSVRFHFKKCPNDSDHLLLVIKRGYRLHNLLSRPQLGTIRHYFEQPLNHGHPSTVLSFVVTADDKILCRFGQAASGDCIQSFTSGIEQGIEAKVTVPAKGHVDVEFRCQVVKRLSDTEALFTKLPLNGIDVAATVHDDLNLIFSLMSAHAEDFERDWNKEDNEYSEEWTLKKPFLPGHGFVLSWRQQPVASFVEQPSPT
jgi:hypothetical protein